MAEVSEPLSPNEIAWYRPPGYAMVERIVRAYDAGESLPDDDVHVMVDALRVFLHKGTTDAHLQEFGKAANLRGKQGRREPTADESERRIGVVTDVLLRERELIGSGEAPTKARAAATKEAAATWHRSIRAVQADLKDTSIMDGARLHMRVIDYASARRDEVAAAAKLATRKNRANKS